MTARKTTKKNNEEPPMFLEKPLPSSPESERVILGAILLDNSIFPQALEILKPEDFYSPLHRRVYAAMQILFERGDRIDPILIGEELKRDGNLESIGGIATITNLTYGLPHFSNITDYVLIARDKAKMRELIKACNGIINAALAEDEPAATVLDEAQTAVNAIAADTERQKTFRRLGTLALESAERKKLLIASGETFTGLRTGFHGIDEKTNGLQKTDLIIIGGRPGMGKSAYIGNVAENVCRLNIGAVVAIFSLEMNEEQYTERTMCASAKVDYNRYKRGLMTRDEAIRMNETIARFQDYLMFVQDDGDMDTLKMRSECQRLKAEQKRLDLVIVDFLQRVRGVGRFDSRQQEISYVARALKSLAKFLLCPVAALVSLSRECEKRNPPKPILSDIRESGDIESEADVVSFIYRENYYNNQADPTLAEFITPKNRHGATGTDYLTWLGEITRFENPSGIFA